MSGDDALALRRFWPYHLEAVVAIEEASFDNPWSEYHFREILAHNGVGVVAEQDWRLVGYLVCVPSGRELDIINLAVDPACRRQGIASRMVAWFWDRYSKRRPYMVVHVRETNLPAQLFFRSEGFQAVRVLRDYYDDTDEDAYRMCCAGWRAAAWERSIVGCN